MTRRTKRGGWPYSQPPNVPFEVNRASPQAKGLVAWWPTLASQGALVLRDLSGYGNDAPFPGPAAEKPTWVTDGLYGSVLKFTGSQNQFIDLGDPAVLNISGNITVSVWFNFSASQGNRPLIVRWGTDESYGLSVPGGGDADKIGFYIRVAEVNKSAVSANTYDDGNWHLATGIFDGSNVLLYIDGGTTESITGDATAGPIDTPAQTIRLGNYNNGIAGSAYTGLLRDCCIYNTAKTRTEAYQMYAKPWELYKPLIRRWLGWKSPIVERIPRYGFTNFQVPGIV